MLGGTSQCITSPFVVEHVINVGREPHNGLFVTPIPIAPGRGVIVWRTVRGFRLSLDFLLHTLSCPSFARVHASPYRSSRNEKRYTL